MGSRIIEIPNCGKEIHISFEENEEGQKGTIAKLFFNIYGWIVELLYLMVFEIGLFGGQVEQLGGDEENFVDTRIIFKGDARKEKITVVYEKGIIKGKTFNLGKVQENEKCIATKFVPNIRYRREVRKLLIGYIIFSIVCLSIPVSFAYLSLKESRIAMLLLFAFAGSGLYYIVRWILKEYRKWDGLFAKVR